MFPFFLQKSGAYEEIQKSFGEEDFVIEDLEDEYYTFDLNNDLNIKNDGSCDFIQGDDEEEDEEDE